MGALKQLSIKIEEEVARLLQLQCTEPGSGAWNAYYPLMVESLHQFVEQELLGLYLCDGCGGLFPKDKIDIPAPEECGRVGICETCVERKALRDEHTQFRTEVSPALPEQTYRHLEDQLYDPDPAVDGYDKDGQKEYVVGVLRHMLEDAPCLKAPRVTALYTALKGMVELSREQGTTIRLLDEDCAHIEEWTNDGNEHGPDYVPDSRWLLAAKLIGLEPS